MEHQEIKTIYLGGGTPLSIGKDHIFGLIDHIIQVWNSESLEEISIELNPDPFDEVLDFIRSCNQRYAQMMRVRYSFGIQTFDDDILEGSGRGYTYNQIKGFLRSLQPLKSAINCYNLDFIAFGSMNHPRSGTKGRNDKKKQFFEDLVASKTFDSFSLYMLELFPGSKRHQLHLSGLNLHNKQILKQCINPDDEQIMSEYTWLSDTVQSYGYKRYEVSNYALPGKESLHNMVYRNMKPYIGIGASASGCIFGSHQKITRYTNISSIGDYIKDKRLNEKKTILLTPEEILFEQFMLGIRSGGIQNIEGYKSLLISGRQNKCSRYESQGLLIQHNGGIKLTNQGYNLANRIISELIH
ncbi:MAG TPA: hypothetical protein PLW93_03680 [Candidatus Absconditabacterales bacterium]|nr:hypothetical protein [Candidatus Absconditabacterales bacterium]HNG97346.1 hypothetical protein [Candidatus Absconditabacterales bacterium]